MNDNYIQLHVLSHLGSIFWDRTWFKVLKKSRIVCKATGLTNGSKNNKHFDDPPYHIDPFYTAYLHKNKQTCQILHLTLVFPHENFKEKLQALRSSQQYAIFQYFVKKYYLLNGHKFGGLFLAYELDYEDTHANLLIFGGQINLNHMTRLAALCKKEGIHAAVQKGKVTITQLERQDGKKRQRQKHRDNMQKVEGDKKVKQDI